MKEKLKKLLAFQQVIVMIFSVVTLLFTTGTTKTYAKAPKVDTEGKNLIRYIQTYSFDVYGISDQVRASVVEAGESANTRNLIVDDGARIFIDPKNDVYEIRAEAWLDGSQIKSFGSNVNEIVFRKEELPERFDLRLLYRTSSLNDLKYWDANVLHVKMRQNEFYFNADKNPNAIVEDGTIYVKPGTTLELSTVWGENSALAKRKGNYSVRDTRFSVQAGSSTLHVPNVAGAEAFIIWRNEYGASINGSLRVLTSNFASSRNNATSYIVKKPSYQDGTIKTTYYNKDGYNIDKEISVHPGYKDEVHLDIALKKRFKNTNVDMRDIDYERVQVSNISGGNVITGEPKYNYDGSECHLTIQVKNEGIVEFRYYDYKKTLHKSYWYILQYDNKAKVERAPDNEQPESEDVDDEAVDDSQLKKNEKIASEPSQPSAGNGNEGGGIGGGSTPIETRTYSVHTSYNYEFKENKIIINNIQTDSHTPVQFAVQKRYNENIPTRTQNVSYSTYGLEGDTFTVYTDTFPEGLYDILIYVSEDGFYMFDIILTAYMGGKYTLNEPVIVAQDTGVRNPESGAITYKYTAENCTEVKYKVIKRANDNEEYDHNITQTYDGFDGTVVSNPKDFSVELNPLVSGAGIYDIVIMGINKASNSNNHIYNTVSKTGINAYMEPAINVTKEEGSEGVKKYRVSASAIDGSTIAGRYYMIKKMNNNEEAKMPSVEEIKGTSSPENGIWCGEFEDNDIIELDSQELEAGYYALTCYAENNYGIGKFTQVSNILISKGTDIKYSVRGEDEHQAGSITPRYVQYVDMQLENDITEDIELTYFISKQDLTEDGKKKISEIFDSNTENKVTKNVKNNQNIEVKLEATKDVNENAYIYGMAKPIGPNSGDITYFSTGSIRLDGRKMGIYSIHLEDFDNKTFIKDDEIEVVVELDHDIETDVSRYQVPILLIKVGNEIVRPDYTNVSDNKITYSYEVDENFPNGEISVYDFEYTTNAAFYGKDAGQYFYNKKLSEDTGWYNFINENEYYVDTVKPEVEQVNIQIETDNSNIKTINGEAGEEIKVITDFSKVNVVMQYSEEVKGGTTTALINKGNKSIFMCYSKNSNARREEVFDITEKLKDEEIGKFEGELSIFSIGSNLDVITDAAGNRLSFPENYTVKYFINGTEFNTQEQSINGTMVKPKVIFDSSVYEPELYSNGKRIDESARCNTGSEFNCFAEFNSEENSNDAVGLEDTVKMNIYYNGASIVRLKDSNGETISNTPEQTYYSVAASDKSRFESVIKYNLNKEQLPVSFTLNSVGNYYIEAEKTDIVGNTSKKESEIVIRDIVSISKENSKLSAFNDEKMHCIDDMTDAEKEYTLTIASSEYMANQLSVFIDDAKISEDELELECVETESTASKNYLKYKFNIYRSGKYKIIVKTKEGDVLLNDYIDVDNAYKIGDTNSNGRIDPDDIIYILKYIVKATGYRTRVIEYAGNVTGDISEITGGPCTDVADAVLLAKFLAEDKTAIIRRSDENMQYNE